MAKLGLVLIAVLCVVQFSLAARLPRDAPAETTTSAFDEWKDKLEESLKGLKDEADKTFTKENVNKLWDNFQTNVKDAGTKLSEIGTEISKNVQTKFAELNKDEKKESV